ncbi:hypothetical protein [Aedoeadaptatus acetigenes]|nr:hypothetical protein [Aedoeadaptatus acetigenes]MCU6787080.1 hypothetical protein [Aedoeadaptatus acetigenes]
MTNRQIDLKRNGIEQAAFARLLDFSASDAAFMAILSDKRQKKQKIT